MTQSAQKQRERRAEKNAAAAANGLKPRPKRHPAGFDVWDAVVGVWRNADGVAAPSKQERHALAAKQSRHRTKMGGSSGGAMAPRPPGLHRDPSHPESSDECAGAIIHLGTIFFCTLARR